MPERRPKLIIITGPTASGKSSLAIDLAIKYNSEIINADSMQVYRGMDIGTAKPSMDERKGIPHHMIDVVNPDETFNASMYIELTGPIIRDILKRKKTCFIVGGTGLYIKTLLGGLLECPPVDLELREELDQEYEKNGQAMYDHLIEADPEAASRIHPNDRIRVVRALEIINLTKKPLSKLIEKHGFEEQNYDVLKLCLSIDRELLYQRINRRSSSMIESGLIEETKALLKKGYSRELKPMKAIGYKHIIEYLDGKYDIDEAINRMQRDTRRYAKRQLTWFRADSEMTWVKPDEIDFIENRIEEFY